MSAFSTGKSSESGEALGHGSLGESGGSYLRAFRVAQSCHMAADEIL